MPDNETLGILLIEAIIQIDALRTALESNPELKNRYASAVHESQDRMYRMLPKNYRVAGTIGAHELGLLQKIRGQG